jgi:hypothetical protein
MARQLYLRESCLVLNIRPLGNWLMVTVSVTTTRSGAVNRPLANVSWPAAPANDSLQAFRSGDADEFSGLNTRHTALRYLNRTAPDAR